MFINTHRLAKTKPTCLAEKKIETKDLRIITDDHFSTVFARKTPLIGGFRHCSFFSDVRHCCRCRESKNMLECGYLC